MSEAEWYHLQAIEHSNHLTYELRALEFVDWSPLDIFSEGYDSTHIVMIKRVFQSEHQYLSLTTYNDTFVEACLMVYKEPFNSRAKPAQRQIPLASRLLRSFDEVIEAVNQIYSPKP